MRVETCEQVLWGRGGLLCDGMILDKLTVNVSPS